MSGYEHSMWMRCGQIGDKRNLIECIECNRYNKVNIQLCKE